MLYNVNIFTVVEAGFAVNSLTFNESASNPSFVVTRLQPIDIDLVLTLSGGKYPNNTIAK